MTETEWFVYICDLRNHKVGVWTSILVAHFVFEMISSESPRKRCWKDFALYFMWAFRIILSARVIVFGYCVSLDQTQTSNWFEALKSCLLESNFTNFWHRDLPNISNSSEYEYDVSTSQELIWNYLFVIIIMWNGNTDFE